MLTLLTTALGFFTSFLPKLADMWQDRQDKKHELAVMDKQLENQLRLAESANKRAMIEGEAQETVAVKEHDQSIMRRAAPWVATLSSTVRPVTTYWLFSIFALLKTVAIVVACIEAYVIYAVAAENVDTITALLSGADRFLEYQSTIWDEPTAALFSSIMAFWFGSREIRRREGRL